MFLLSIRILVNRKERMKKRRGDDQIIRDNAADNMTIPHVHILRWVLQINIIFIIKKAPFMFAHSLLQFYNCLPFVDRCYVSHSPWIQSYFLTTKNAHSLTGVMAYRYGLKRWSRDKRWANHSRPGVMSFISIFGTFAFKRLFLVLAPVKACC